MVTVGSVELLNWNFTTRRRVTGRPMRSKMMAEDGGFVSDGRTVIQEFLEAEMSEAIVAQKGERHRRAGLGYRSGYYPRSLITRVGNSS